MFSKLKNPEGNAGFIFNNGKGGILVFRKIVFPSFKSQRIHKNVKIAELYTPRAGKKGKIAGKQVFFYHKNNISFLKLTSPFLQNILFHKFNISILYHKSIGLTKNIKRKIAI